jgi:hypothetical protein
MLPVGQQLWLKELESYIEFPPLQDPARYNLVQVLEQVKKMGERQPSKCPGRKPHDRWQALAAIGG